MTFLDYLFNCVCDTIYIFVDNFFIFNSTQLAG